jgi:MFS family permease
MTAAPPSASALPPGAFYVNGFSFFNAVSFQIILGAPVILFAKSLGASSLVLGIIASLTPLLTILQLVAARFLHRVGYRRFILAGWGTRTLFTLAVAVLPVWPSLAPGSRLYVLVAALFGFNLLRGLASGAWLPWLTALIPEGGRGRFLSRDQAFMHAGCLVALIVSAWVMSGSVEAWEYTAVFSLGVVAAMASLWFIKRVPDVDSPEELRRSAVRVPWRAMLRFPPFARLLGFSLLYMFVAGGLGVFTIEFLVAHEKFSEGAVLVLSALAFVGALAGLAIAGPAIDRTGSKPWLRHTLALLGVVVTGWWAIAAGVLPGWPVMVGALNFFGGVSGAVFGLASTRTVMSSVPRMGRNHFFALFTVVTSLGLGGAPVAWGAMLDTVGTLEIAWPLFLLNRYSIYFGVLIPLVLAARSLVRRLHDGENSTHHEIFEQQLALRTGLPGLCDD